MRRNAIQDLITWKASWERKPMVLKGACQVGETWLMKEFGKNSYDMAVIDNSAILLKTDYQFKGPLTESYVLQQLRGQLEVEPRYFADKNSELDFIIQSGAEIIPVEAKGGKDKSALSFKRYVANNRPEHAIRFSKRGCRKDCYIINLPLCLARKTKELL